MTISDTSVDQHDWVGAIVTAYGNTVDVLDFKARHVDLADIAQSISLICRYNGHLPSFYSVAEHSVRVAAYLEEQGCSLEVQLTGLLHDAAEAYVGDMVRPLKRVPEVGGKHQEMEAHIEAVIHDVLGGVFPHPPEVAEADKAVYYWEVDNIRTGKKEGLDWETAKYLWLNEYHALMKLIDDQRRS